MNFGPVVCTAACGLIVFGLSILTGLLLIRPEELRVVRKHRLLAIPLLSAISLMLLMVVGADGTFLFYSVWFLGALAGGVISSLVATRARLAY